MDYWGFSGFSEVPSFFGFYLGSRGVCKNKRPPQLTDFSSKNHVYKNGTFFGGIIRQKRRNRPPTPEPWPLTSSPSTRWSDLTRRMMKFSHGEMLTFGAWVPNLWNVHREHINYFAQLSTALGELVDPGFFPIIRFIFAHLPQNFKNSVLIFTQFGANFYLNSFFVHIFSKYKEPYLTVDIKHLVRVSNVLTSCTFGVFQNHIEVIGPTLKSATNEWIFSKFKLIGNSKNVKNFRQN